MLSTNYDGCSTLLCSLWELILTEELTYVGKKKKNNCHIKQIYEPTNSCSIMECKWTYSI